MFQIENEIILYQTEDGQTKVEVRMEGETVWLTQSQMAELFQTTKQNVSLHVKNAFSEGELDEIVVVKEYLTTAADGKNYLTKNYNLDVIISVGYRVKSHRGTQFRIWATQRVREYIIKGFALDDDRLKRAGQMNYFDELKTAVNMSYFREYYAGKPTRRVLRMARKLAVKAHCGVVRPAQGSEASPNRESLYLTGLMFAKPYHDGNKENYHSTEQRQRSRYLP